MSAELVVQMRPGDRGRVTTLDALAAELGADPGPLCPLCGTVDAAAWVMCWCGLLVCASCEEHDLVAALGLCRPAG